MTFMSGNLALCRISLSLSLLPNPIVILSEGEEDREAHQKHVCTGATHVAEVASAIYFIDYSFLSLPLAIDWSSSVRDERDEQQQHKKTKEKEAKAKVKAKTKAEV